ncbi:helix-turn-helix transcriptional regulator [Actinoplanes sp. NEAU-A12]|uniref:Helix-turn-helix transcriptional regulator n=1 Tax=Actinoplanes sandaracinus TaxID=3045177 RepID=A0ABT6WHD7_9ACTN|nr:helix-turn-helix transcriptional regulator [Actinoplanes sandaracinus]MDI6099147.1 helix-turn-helix transcriptional regulator [Actinoplanes sandaracinus]
MVRRVPQPEFGLRLRRMRIERGLSQRDLAVGSVNQSYISLLESGSRVPTLETVVHLAGVLGVPLNTLVDDVPLHTDSPAVGSWLAEDVITSSAIDHGDLEGAQTRLATTYRAALANGSADKALHHGLGLERILEMRGDQDGRYRLLTELVEMAVRVGVPEAAVRTRIALASAARDVGRLAEALTQVEAAQQEIDDSSFVNGPEHVRLLAVHTSVLSDAGGSIEVERIIERMLTMASQLGNRAIAGRAHWVASVALARLGEVEKSLVHLQSAREMLANPSTSLREWARFTRAAASALLDAEAGLAEIEPAMLAARAATAASEAGDGPTVSVSLEVRYALAVGDPERALEIASTVDEETLTGIEKVRFVLALGRAQRRCGREEEAVATLSRAGQLAESAAAYRRAAQIWREVAGTARQ